MAQYNALAIFSHDGCLIYPKSSIEIILKLETFGFKAQQIT